MQTLAGRVVSLHGGGNGDPGKPERKSLQVELDGIVGDKHRGYTRRTWAADKQPKGTIRRNERAVVGSLRRGT